MNPSPLASPRPTPKTLVPLALAVLMAMAASPGTAAPPISVRVDASRATQGIFHSHLVVPAAAGELVLTYPKWIPGEHSPTGPIQQLVGLRFSAGGKPIAWRRDAVDMFAFHLAVPAGGEAIEADFDYLSPQDSFGGGYGEGPNATAHWLVVLWNQQVLVPRGTPSDAAVFRPSLVLPSGWNFDSALDVAARSADAVEFAPVSLTVLVDSPVLAGEHFRSFPVAAGDGPVRLSVAADDPADLAVPEARLHQLRQVVAEAQALFGARHYRRYAWLVTLTDALDPNGLEHPESSDNRLPAHVFSDDRLGLAELRILPHEYVHSWNGKHRRPGGLATPDYERPMDGSLLWIYEGLTRYLGDVVLATRAGIRPAAATRDYLAWMASQLEDSRPGRRWRPLVDTATAVQLGVDAPGAGSTMRRPLDYYEEGALIWLEADARLRELSGGKRSLDDFCRAFAGPPGGQPALRVYDLDEVAATLEALAPGRWREFLADRVERVQAPLGGLAAAGWKLGYGSEPNVFMAGRQASRHQIDWGASLGIRTNDEGELLEVIQDSPAFAAGLVAGEKIVGVDSAKWSAEALARSLGEAFAAGRPLELLVDRRGELSTARLTPARGAVYPHLERVAGTADRLSEILTARAAP
jgi:predicted metalloprotease with PDZ domain